MKTAFLLHAALVLQVYAQPPDGPPPEGGPPTEGGPPPDGGPPETFYEPYAITGTTCADIPQFTGDLCTMWWTNENGTLSTTIDDALVDVETVTFNSNQTEVTVYTSGIPSYQVSITQETVDSLNSRPLAARDFTNGATTTVAAGDVVDFGEDIGYAKLACALGYWPPGPECPKSVYKALTFPTNPKEAVEEVCDTGLGALGLFVNGVSIFGWGDGQSYNREGLWYNLAVKFEIMDLDLCGGHAAAKEYHHHSYSDCIESKLGDGGENGHSPTIGLMGDGYFLYGKYQDTQVKAQSCWKTRDYTNPDDPLGCEGDGTRTCVLVDNKDPNKGTTAAGKDGPAVTDQVESLSGNLFTTESGSYYEDYYFDVECHAQGGEYLDEHNGHSHGDYGYHYHATESFPYMPGPDTLYGVPTDTDSFCGGTVGPPDDVAVTDGGPPTESTATDDSSPPANNSGSDEAQTQAPAAATGSSASRKVVYSFGAGLAAIFVFFT